MAASTSKPPSKPVQALIRFGKIRYYWLTDDACVSDFFYYMKLYIELSREELGFYNLFIKY